MITLQKEPGRDFIILNLTDPQLNNEEWENGRKESAILIRTITELMEGVKPNLVTVSGDLAWALCDKSYDAFADLMDSFEVPWAPVWGNHDHQKGAGPVEEVVRRYKKHKYCRYEEGDPAMGNGNYIIRIEEEGRPVEGVFMIDSHDHCMDEEGNHVYARLLPSQIDWYRREVQELKNQGCEDTVMIMHIPIYAYREASAAAYRSDLDLAHATYEMFQGDCWAEGYEDSIGVQLEGIGSYPHEDGVLDAVRELGSTKYIIAGHDHINNWMITYKGVRLVYALKAGVGCYWDPRLNGGTVIRVTSNGISEVYHEYVDVQDLL